MQTDDYGQIILSELDLCEAFLQNPDLKLRNALVEHVLTFDPELELTSVPELHQYQESQVSLEEFDSINQAHWHMPREYQDFDIAQWVLDQCQTDSERQRVGEELLLYLDRNLFPLLNYLKYIVDVMRKHNIVWGVGRGSSVSSYVLFLIGIHRINSMYYDLDVTEFLR
jgi:DNA polymerase III alpha subunit